MGTTAGNSFSFQATTGTPVVGSSPANFLYRTPAGTGPFLPSGTFPFADDNNPRDVIATVSVVGTAAAVPEPATLAVFGGLLAAGGFAARRRTLA